MALNIINSYIIVIQKASRKKACCESNTIATELTRTDDIIMYIMQTKKKRKLTFDNQNKQGIFLSFFPVFSFKKIENIFLVFLWSYRLKHLWKLRRTRTSCGNTLLWIMFPHHSRSPTLPLMILYLDWNTQNLFYFLKLADCNKLFTEICHRNWF